MGVDSLYSDNILLHSFPLLYQKGSVNIQSMQFLDVNDITLYFETNSDSVTLK